MKKMKFLSINIGIGGMGDNIALDDVDVEDETTTPVLRIKSVAWLPRC